MKIVCCMVMFGFACGVASAQPMAAPVPVPLGPPVAEPFAGDVPPPIAAPDARPVLPERGPRLGPDGHALTPMGDAAVEDAPPPKDCFRVSLDDGSMILGEIEGDSKVSLKA